MDLSTTLHVKKMLRRAILYQYWNPNVKKKLRELIATIVYKVALIRNRIVVHGQASAWVFIKNGRKIIIPKEESVFEMLHIARDFDVFFSIQELDCPNHTIDFTNEIKIAGYYIRTNLGMIHELKSGIETYNKYYQIKKGDIVFDCGAFHGIYAILISKKVGIDGQIYCFEPDEKNRTVLQGNIKRNGIKNITIVKSGVWKTSGVISFSSGCDATSSAVFSPNSSTSYQTVDVVSIPAFVKSRNIKNVSFVKMDIEGAEIEAIEGSLDFLINSQVHFAIASYHLRGGRETYHDLEPLFQKVGYHSFTEITDTITTYASPISFPDSPCSALKN